MWLLSNCPVLEHEYTQVLNSTGLWNERVSPWWSHQTLSSTVHLKYYVLQLLLLATSSYQNLPYTCPVNSVSSFFIRCITKNLKKEDMHCIVATSLNPPQPSHIVCYVVLPSCPQPSHVVCHVVFASPPHPSHVVCHVVLPSPPHPSHVVCHVMFIHGVLVKSMRDILQFLFLQTANESACLHASQGRRREGEKYSEH